MSAEIIVRRRKGRNSVPPPQPVPDPDLQRFYEDWFLPLVRRAKWRHNLSGEDARDVVQDAFVLALRRLDPAKNPKLWLRQVVDNLSLNLIRKSRRRSQLLRRWGSGESDNGGQTETE